MPTRIRCPDKPLDMQQGIESTMLNAPSPRNSKACYTGRRPKLRILCGSIQSLFVTTEERRKKMKMATRLGFLVIGSLFSLGLCFSQEVSKPGSTRGSERTMWVAASALNMRKDATTSSQRIATLEYGTEVDVLDTTDAWTKIQAAQGTGWVASKYLSDSEPAKVEGEVLNIKGPKAEGRVVGEFTVVEMKEKATIPIDRPADILKGMVTLKMRDGREVAYRVGRDIIEGLKVGDNVRCYLSQDGKEMVHCRKVPVPSKPSQHK
jgi:uncharacterized protein YgiM (DUF1202 family)